MLGVNTPSAIVLSAILLIVAGPNNIAYTEIFIRMHHPEHLLNAPKVSKNVRSGSF